MVSYSLAYQAICGSNVHDQHFVWRVEEFEVKVLADSGFHAREGDLENLHTCQRGEQER